MSGLHEESALKKFLIWAYIDDEGDKYDPGFEIWWSSLTTQYTCPAYQNYAPSE